MNNNDIIDLSEDISELCEFLPLNIENLYPSFLLQNCLVRKNTEFYNNVALNVCHFYNYVLHTFLCRLYLAENKNVEFLKYIQKTKEVFSGKDGRRKNIDICDADVNLTLFNEIEKEAINYFFYLLKFDKSHQVYKLHQDIIDIRNVVAHLNYESISYELFITLVKKIKDNLLFLSKCLYSNTKTVFYQELDPPVRKGIMDKENYLEYIANMNKTHYFSQNDYKLTVKNNLLKDIKIASYKYFLDMYIKNVLGLSIEDMS